MSADKNRLRKIIRILEQGSDAGAPLEQPPEPPPAQPSAAVPATVAVPGTRATKDSATDKKAGKAPESPKTQPTPAAVTPLAKFLADNVALYFDKIKDAVTYPNQQTLSSKILAGGGTWGPASKAALAAFVDNVKLGRGAPEFSPDLNLDTDLGTAKDIDDPKNYAGKKEYDISGGESGLIDFLKFSYVVKRPGGEATGIEAAGKMRIEPNYGSPIPIPQNSLWRALCQIGSIVPFPFMSIIPPAGGKIPKGAILQIGDDPEAAKLRFSQEMGSMVLLLGGADKGQKVIVPGFGDWSASFGLENSKKLIGMIGKTVNAKIQTPGGDFSLSGIKIEMGVSFDFSNAERGARTLPMSAAEVGATAKQLSGEISMQQQARPSTRENPSWGGESRPFELQNVYLNAAGNPALNKVDVILYKRITNNRDVFELRIQNPGAESILIPVRMSARSVAMAEIPSITALAKLGTPNAAGITESTFFYPVSSLEWQFEGRQVKYGDTAPAIGLVDFVPSSPDVIDALQEKGINIRTDVDQAAVQEAIRQYVRDDNNPVGTALYRSSALIYAMNNIPRPGR